MAFDGPKLAVIATGKRTGKTAVAGHWAALLRDEGADPVIVCMGRGGPAEPRVAEAAPSLDELIAIAESGSHAASDYLEDAVIAGRADGRLPAGGRRLRGRAVRVERARGRRARGLARPGRDRLRGLGRVHPARGGGPDGVHPRAPGRPEPFAEYRLARADLVLAAEGAPDPPPDAIPFTLRPEPFEPMPEGARVAVFTTGATLRGGRRRARCSSPPTWRAARRSAAELDRAAAERCDVYLTELKAAAIDTVALRARAEGARVVFIRNRPVGIDDALVKLYRDAAETIVVHKGHGLPYSKGLMAQTISATGLSAGARVRARS